MGASCWVGRSCNCFCGFEPHFRIVRAKKMFRVVNEISKRQNFFNFWTMPALFTSPWTSSVCAKCCCGGLGNINIFSTHTVRDCPFTNVKMTFTGLGNVVGRLYSLNGISVLRKGSWPIENAKQITSLSSTLMFQYSKLTPGVENTCMFPSESNCSSILVIR